MFLRGVLMCSAEEFGAIESVKAASDLMAPVSGKVLEVNALVLKDMGLVNKKAETDGWRNMKIVMCCANAEFRAYGEPS